MPNLSQLISAIRSVNAQIAGATNVIGTHVDMSDADGVLFIMGVGALTATQVTALKAQGGALANDSDQADIAGAVTPALADTDGNKIVLLDVYRPQQRFIRPVVLRSVANAVIDFVIAVVYQIDKMPPALDATVKSRTVLPGV